MGNGFDFQRESGLFIRTHQPFYIAGQDVSGDIYLNVARGSFLSSTIYLKVRGSEKVQWVEKKIVLEKVSDPPQQNQKIVTQYYDNQNEFYQHKIPVYEFSQELIPQGQYNFPFNFKLKENLPASFKYPENENENDLQCRIRYSVKAEIVSEDKNIKGLKCKQEFLVREPIRDQSNQNEGQQILHSCFCIPLGRTSFKCRFSQSSYESDENAELQVEIDNSQSKVGIPTITGTLINTLKIMSQSGHTKLIHRTCGTTMTPGLQAGQSALKEKSRKMTLKLIDQTSNQPLLPTTNGKFVKNNYHFSFSGDQNGTCLYYTTAPGQEFPIMIVANPIPNDNTLVEAPSGWNPEVINLDPIRFCDSSIYYRNFLIPSQNQNSEGSNINQPYNE